MTMKHISLIAGITFALVAILDWLQAVFLASSLTSCVIFAVGAFLFGVCSLAQFIVWNDERELAKAKAKAEAEFDAYIKQLFGDPECDGDCDECEEEMFDGGELRPDPNFKDQGVNPNKVPDSL